MILTFMKLGPGILMDIFVQCRHSFTVDHESGSDFILREHLPLHDIYCDHVSVRAYTFEVLIFGKLVKPASQ